MAEQALDSNDKKKPKSKFGMIMNSVGRSAKKKMSRAGQSFASGAAKAKQKAVQKIAKVPITEEDPQIISSLQQLKITKTEIHSISDTARNLYETTAITTQFLYQLSEKLKEVKKMSEHEAFAEYCHKKSTNLAYLSGIKYQYFQNMETQLVIPLEQFAENDIDKMQKLKVKYKNSKIQFDMAAHKLTKSQQSESKNQSKDQSKIKTATKTKQEANKHLLELRNEFKCGINNLKDTKNEQLLANIEQYWMAYIKYVESQNGILNGNISNNINIMQMNNITDNEMKNEGYPGITSITGLPPPTQQYDDKQQNEQCNQQNNEYNQHANDDHVDHVEENDNAPTHAYNPFDD